jgi:hypothetical protein
LFWLSSVAWGRRSKVTVNGGKNVKERETRMEFNEKKVKNILSIS